MSFDNERDTPRNLSFDRRNFLRGAVVTLGASALGPLLFAGEAQAEQLSSPGTTHQKRGRPRQKKNTHPHMKTARARA